MQDEENWVPLGIETMAQLSAVSNHLTVFINHLRSQPAGRRIADEVLRLRSELEELVADEIDPEVAREYVGG